MKGVHLHAKLIFTSLLLAGTSATDLYARVVRVDITRVESPTFGGVSFGTVGQYEKLVGRVYGEVDPNDPINSQIADIGLAPKNSSGFVEYSADIYILRPVDPSMGNHRLLTEVNNRGNNLSSRRRSAYRVRTLRTCGEKTKRKPTCEQSQRSSRLYSARSFSLRHS